MYETVKAALVIDNRAEARFYRKVVFVRESEPETRLTCAAHRRAGQYVRVRAAVGDDKYFAIARTPSADGTGIELLLKPGGVVADHIIGGGVGARVDMSDPEGEGFDLTAASGRDVCLLAAGSGIAPIRALLGSLLAERSRFGRISLYYGQSAPEDFAYRDELSQLTDVDVTLALPEETAGWTGAVGYVQHVARDVLVSPDVTIYACGMDDMLREAQSIAGRPIHTS
jgi:NAD(P)H-flavin reductase